MVNLVRIFSVCLCCFTFAWSASPTEVQAMDAIFDDFADGFGDKPEQCAVGAAKGVIENGPKKAYAGKGYWYTYFDKDGASVNNAAGEVVGEGDFKDAVDKENDYLFLQLVTSTSDNEYPYAGAGCPFTVNSDYHDLSKMTALRLKVKGSGTVRFFFKTEDYEDENWGYYGYVVDLTADWKTFTIDVDDLEGAEGSLAYEEDWFWDHGKDAVAEFSFQVVADEGTGDADLYIDEIALVGMTYGDFDFIPLSVLAAPRTAGATDQIAARNGQVQFSIAQTSHCSVQLFDMAGSHVATLFNGNANAGKVQSLQTGNVAAGQYLAVLKSAGNAVTRPLTITGR